MSDTLLNGLLRFRMFSTSRVNRVVTLYCWLGGSGVTEKLAAPRNSVRLEPHLNFLSK